MRCAMNECDTIDPSQPLPVTIGSIGSDLSALGVLPGTTLLVHSSLSSLGWVCGGDGRSMGKIPETFRKMSEVIRSNHPHVSFAARGLRAAELLRNVSLDNSLGPDSPLGRLYDLDGSILLLGVSFESNTMLHLAEYLAQPRKKVVRNGYPSSLAGSFQWADYEDIEFDTSEFEALGKAFEQAGGVRVGLVGAAQSRLMKARDLVGFAVDCMEGRSVPRGFSSGRCPDPLP